MVYTCHNLQIPRGPARYEAVFFSDFKI